MGGAVSEQRVYVAQELGVGQPLIARMALEDAILDTAEYLNGVYVPDPAFDYRREVREQTWQVTIFSLPLQGEVLRPRCHGRFVRDFDAPHFIFQRNDGDDHAPE